MRFRAPGLQKRTQTPPILADLRMIEHEPINHLCGNRNPEWSPVCSATPIPLGERVMVNTDKLVIAADARRCYDAGAAVIHYHGRGPNGEPLSEDAATNIATQRKIRAETPLVAYPTYGNQRAVLGGYYSIGGPRKGPSPRGLVQCLVSVVRKSPLVFLSPRVARRSSRRTFSPPDDHARPTRTRRTRAVIRYLLE
jgi:hypothetical protein